MLHLIIIPGLGDQKYYTKFITLGWERIYNIKIHIILFGWLGEGMEYDFHLKRTSMLVDKILKDNNKVSILGISAGASAAINIFNVKRNELNKVAIVCGRLRDVNVKRKFYYPVNQIDIFKESIKHCEKNQKELTKEDKKRILTISPFYDDVVPVKTMTIEGALNKKVFAVQHMISIFLIMTLYSKIIADFLINEEV